MFALLRLKLQSVQTSGNSFISHTHTVEKTQVRTRTCFKLSLVLKGPGDWDSV